MQVPGRSGTARRGLLGDRAHGAHPARDVPPGPDPCALGPFCRSELPRKGGHMRQGSTAQNSMARRRWADLTGSQKALVVALGSVQLSLAAAAWVDLAARPRTRVNGRKAVWAAVIAVNWIGPLAYFRWGRR